MTKIENQETVVSSILQNMNLKPEELKFKISELDEDYRSGALVIDPEYQRNYVYEDNFKVPSKMIESIFMGLIIPEIQLFVDSKEHVYEIIDGQQRVLSLIKFYRNEYALKGLEVLTDLNGYTYAELPNSLQRLYKSFNIHARAIKKNTEYKFEVFERLNQGAKKLNAQEIRNCIYRGSVLSLARDLAKEPLVKSLFEDEFGFKNDRQQLTEYILRLLALIDGDGVQKEAGLSKNINAFLDKRSSEEFSNEELTYLSQRFLAICSFMLDHKIGKDVFKCEGGIKTNLEPFFVNLFLTKYDLKLFKPELLRINLMKCFSQNTRYNETRQNGSQSSSKNTNERIQIIKRILTKCT